MISHVHEVFGLRTSRVDEFNDVQIVKMVSGIDSGKVNLKFAVPFIQI